CTHRGAFWTAIVTAPGLGFRTMHAVLAVAVAVAALLAAAPGGAPDSRQSSQQIKLASPGLGAVNLKKERVDFFADHFAQELINRGIRVITAKEVGAVLGLAR